MQNIPEYRVRELASFFKAMTGKEAMEVSSDQIFHYACIIRAPWVFRIKFRYRILAFLKHPFDILAGHLFLGRSLITNEFMEDK